MHGWWSREQLPAFSAYCWVTCRSLSSTRPMLGLLREVPPGHASGNEAITRGASPYGSGCDCPREHMRLVIDVFTRTLAMAQRWGIGRAV